MVIGVSFTTLKLFSGWEKSKSSFDEKTISTRFQIDFFFPLFLAFGAMKAVPASPKWREKHPAFPPPLLGSRH